MYDLRFIRFGFLQQNCASHLSRETKIENNQFSKLKNYAHSMQPILELPSAHLGSRRRKTLTIPLILHFFSFFFTSGLVWYGMVWFGMVWFGMVWFGLVWYGHNFQQISWFIKKYKSKIYCKKKFWSLFSCFYVIKS